MKRKTLTTAVLAGLTGMAGMVGVSNAVNLNPDGLGQVLLYPYYSARGGNDTLLSIVNTTDNAKSVKIRFIEGLNSREVLDFNIYMSAFDVWVTAITGAENGGGKIIVADNTCTSPYFRLYPGQYDVDENDVAEVPFRRFEFTNNPDGATTDFERTASGYVEVIEMGTLVDDTNGSATAATHSDGVPADCQQLDNAWTSGLPAGVAYWLGDPSIDHEPPSGGLFGAASIINVQDGTLFSYNATALDAFNEETVHTDPGSLLPDLNSGVPDSTVFINGVVDNQTWQQGVEAVSATILYDQVMNEYVTGGMGNARSEWVLTFPTKRFYVDEAGGYSIAPAPVPPFTQAWDVTTGTACEVLEYSIWDREERTTQLIGPPIPSPPPEDPSDDFELCYESNVIRFGSADDIPDTSEILNEPRFQTIPSADFQFNNGWVRFEFNEDPLAPTHATRPTASSAVYLGLPVIGFWVNTFTNGSLVDDTGTAVLANYGGSFAHRGSRRIGEAIIQ